MLKVEAIVELLQHFIYQQGGSVRPSEIIRDGKNTYDLLAEIAGVRSEERDLMTGGSYPEPLWENRVRWARNRLKDKGILEKGIRGKWILTQKAFDFLEGMKREARTIDVLKRFCKGQSDFFGRNGEYTDRFIVFEAYGAYICNPFLDEIMCGKVEKPEEYYGELFLNSDFYSTVRAWINKLPQLNNEEVVERMIKYVTYDNYKELIKGAINNDN